MLAIQCKTQLDGEPVRQVYRGARNIAEAIHAFEQHIKSIKGITLTQTKMPLDIKLVVCND